MWHEAKQASKTIEDSITNKLSSTNENERNGLPILNEISIHGFKERIDKYKAMVDVLRELLKIYLLNEKYWYDEN